MSVNHLIENKTADSKDAGVDGKNLATLVLAQNESFEGREKRTLGVPPYSKHPLCTQLLPRH